MAALGGTLASTNPCDYLARLVVAFERDLTPANLHPTKEVVTLIRD